MRKLATYPPKIEKLITKRIETSETDRQAIYIIIGQLSISDDMKVCITA